MSGLIEIVFEYQLLRTKSQRLRMPLSAGEQARLASLETLLQGEGIGIDTRRAMPRLPAPASVYFTVEDGFGSGRLTNLSGQGLAIQTDARAAIGDRTVVRITGADFPAEYEFPARVVWVGATGRGIIGLEFDGIPIRCSIRERRAAPLVA